MLMSVNLSRLTYPIVQLSLDLTSLDEALETAAVGVEAGVDWLEAGRRYSLPTVCMRSRPCGHAFPTIRSLPT